MSRTISRTIINGQSYTSQPDNLLIGWLGIGGSKIRENASMWIWIDEPYWNKGICEEALSKAVHFAFCGLKTKCVNIRLCDNNYHADKFEYDYTTPIPKTKGNSPYNYDNPVRKVDSIEYIKEPAGYLCGQSVIAMLAGVSVDEVVKVMENDKGTSTSEIRDMLRWYGLKTATKARIKYTSGTVLPECCILSVQLPGYGHWSLYYKDKYYDPEFGVLDKLPEQAKLRYFWEIV